MLHLLTFLLVLLFPRQEEPAPPSPFDRVVPLELAAPEAGSAPEGTVELDLSFTGTLHLWTSSDLDLRLRVEDPRDESLAAEDDDSGGGGVPYLARAVEPGARLTIRVLSRNGASAGRVELHVVAAPETERTRAAGRLATDARAEVIPHLKAGDLPTGRDLVREVVSELLATPGAEHSEEVAQGLWGQAILAWKAKDEETARRAWSAVLAHRRRTLPRDHTDLLRAAGNVATAALQAGDVDEAHALLAEVLASYERTGDVDASIVRAARQNLAVVKRRLGDLLGARRMMEAVLDELEGALPEDDLGLLRLKNNVAALRSETGDLSGARELAEAVLEVYERIRPADDPSLITARGQVAFLKAQAGDLTGALALRESVLASCERILPAGHVELQQARDALALILQRMGDFPGALALRNAVLEELEQTRPEGDARILSARLNLASSLHANGDLSGARALGTAVLEDYEELLPPDHPERLDAQAALARTLWDLGESERAIELQESVLAGRARTLPPDHPKLLAARWFLAGFRAGVGDLDGAIPEQEAVVAAYEATLSLDDLTRLDAAANLTLSLLRSGDLARAHERAPELIEGLRERALGGLTRAPRRARELVASVADRLALLETLTRSADKELQERFFELLETQRLVASEAARVLQAAEDPEVAYALERARAVREALHAQALDTEAHDRSARLLRLVQERDRLEDEASRLLSERGFALPEVRAASVATALPEDSALVTFHRLPQLRLEEDRRAKMGPDHLIAHVLHSDRPLVRVDLGTAAELEELVAAWREALGRPLRSRGVTPGGGARATGDDPDAAGEALRVRLFDPLLAHLDADVRTVHLCADDLVFLVPLDALPLGEGVVGDRITALNEVSCARLLDTDAPEPAGPGLLLVGGVDYDSGVPRPDERVALAQVDLRSGTAGFAPLPGTHAEIVTLQEQFEQRFDTEPLLLDGAQATKQRFADAVAGKRWIHVATHGWFAPETLRSQLDAHDDFADAQPSEEADAAGMAPMLLCGLALAGANGSRDALGRMDGLMTAEELSTLDLRDCELAVLSACETNVGVRRAGQGIQSLQAALYAAGARSSITSLWKVDDEATRRLFEAFYRYLWEDGLTKSAALEEARRDLRRAGAPARDWAAWVLTGAPE